MSMLNNKNEDKPLLQKVAQQGSDLRGAQPTMGVVRPNSGYIQPEGVNEEPAASSREDLLETARQSLMDKIKNSGGLEAIRNVWGGSGERSNSSSPSSKVENSYNDQRNTFPMPGYRYQQNPSKPSKETFQQLREESVPEDLDKQMAPEGLDKQSSEYSRSVLQKLAYQPPQGGGQGGGGEQPPEGAPPGGMPPGGGGGGPAPAPGGGAPPAGGQAPPPAPEGGGGPMPAGGGGGMPMPAGGGMPPAGGGGMPMPGGGAPMPAGGAGPMPGQAPGEPVPPDAVVVSAGDLDEAIQKAVEKGKAEAGTSSGSEGEDQVASSEVLSNLQQQVSDLKAEVAKLSDKPVEEESASLEGPSEDNKTENAMEAMFNDEAVKSGPAGTSEDKDQITNTASETDEQKYERWHNFLWNHGDAEKRHSMIDKIKQEV